jgi:taurine dioxygenase
MPVVAQEAKQYNRIRVAPLTGALGAEVSGVQLRDLDDETFAELHDAWLEHKVVFFRDQELTRDEHVAYGSRWGSLEQHPFTPNEADHPQIVVLESTPERFIAAEEWHSDVTWRECPSLGSILRGVVIPPVGGDTCWANMELAYDQLPDRVKEQIEGKVAVHSFVKVFGFRLSEEDREQKRKEFPDQLHPVVRTHPETGRRSLYVNRPFTMHIEGLEPDESARVLKVLYRQASVPQFQCRFRWQPGSVAQWDNRCTQHYAVPDFAGQHRRMERVTVEGDRPR